MTKLQPIETAPKDGTVVTLLHPIWGECEAKYGSRAIRSERHKSISGKWAERDLGRKLGWFIKSNSGRWVMIGKAYTHWKARSSN